MAVVDKYVDANVAAGKLTTAAFIHGSKTITIVATFEVAVSDEDGSVYRVAKNVPADLIPTRFDILSDAIADATDWELGLYETTQEDGLDGVAIDIDVFLGSTDINAGNARGSELNGLTAVPIEDVQKRIYEHAGDTLSTRKLGYDIAFTANTVGSAVGTISIIMDFVQG